MADTYLMKLFDRTVDLAIFNEDTPLYMVCRAWIRNQPQNRSLGPRDPNAVEYDQTSDEASHFKYDNLVWEATMAVYPFTDSGALK